MKSYAETKRTFPHSVQYSRNTSSGVIVSRPLYYMIDFARWRAAGGIDTGEHLASWSARRVNVCAATRDTPEAEVS